jgi:microcompartment protein CcmL/EutN
MNALGMIECLSIPKGIEAADSMLKTAAVSLVTAQAVCAGKYVVLVSGDVAAVAASVEAGKNSCGGTLIDSLVIPSIHPQVLKAVSACSDVPQPRALGIMETFSLCVGIKVADAAVKAADIALIEIRLGRGLGGKAFVILTGDVSACEAAVKAGENADNVAGLIAQSVIIPSPNMELVRNAIY